MTQASTLTLHASSVAMDGRGLLIRGQSGSGKSALALALLSRGAALVADDVTQLTRQEGDLILSCPEAGRGLIEARGVGILAVGRVVDQSRLTLVVDMDAEETERLPPARQCEYLGLPVDLVRRSEGPHFADAVWCYLTGRRHV